MPPPDISEPDRRQDVQRRRLWTSIRHGEPNQDVFRVGLRVFRFDIEVLVVIEDTRIDQLELGIVPCAARVLLQQPFVWIRRLRVLVEEAHVRVRGRVVQVEVILLDVLPMIAFRVRDSEQPLFQDAITAVPQCQREADLLVAIGDSREAVLAPSIRARTRMIVGEVAPRVAVGAVILADRAPAAFAQIRTPAFPVAPALAGLLETDLFGGRHRFTIPRAASPMPQYSFRVPVKIT
jgi:hypothetical protein